MADVIADLVDAQLHIVSVNEIALDQKDSVDVPGTPQHDDPVKFRLGAFIPADRNKYYIGTISFDVLRRKDGKIHRTEVGFFKLAVDEFVEGDGDPVPMVELFLGTNSEGSTDADIDRVFTISRKGVRFTVPGGGAGFDARQVRRMWSNDGLFFTQQQDDGNFVSYRVNSPFNIGAAPVALWSAWTGRIEEP